MCQFVLINVNENQCVDVSVIQHVLLPCISKSPEAFGTSLAMLDHQETAGKWHLFFKGVRCTALSSLKGKTVC